ncbi:hypothetical protein G6F62_004232 [Rhizopus arrhizus]|uniref:J domain-containing protein n=1 Tax=Rhizopus oryzae TaxID=64495 RepID=A0A9P6X8M6_RHIOR|nr:hypothetical protein G6F23_005930 [Rhizopus arrhizus]KAG0761474.1 hypothetical protein G6F24_007534 [Rhizopus arrhizus]KAG0943632.1 hypothetical protein G6F32_007627 [Rhizopus arrhizus]KAG1292243.1 hypothetical protein G6F66_007130 [Rhizopus arrhizus]KAG1307881.1 hypothetical protein G6F64_006466 [Rhizopus arrhizus]
MSIALREENFVVINVGSTITTAGIGMHDTNKAPTVFVNMADFNYPIKNNRIDNWKDLEECWHHILFKELRIKKSRNESPVLIAVPVQWTKLEHERITQIFFENFNVPGVYIAPQPLLTLFGCGAVSGVVIDIGSQTTDVNIVVDSNIQTQSSFMIPMGGNQLDSYLLQLLEKDTQLVEAFKRHQMTLDTAFAKHVRELPRTCHVGFGHELNKDVKQELTKVMEEIPTTATEELLDEDNPKSKEDEDDEDYTPPDYINIDYQGHSFTLGPYRHQVFDPLFAPDLIGSDTLSLPDAVRLAVMNCEPPEIRSKLWESIALTGGCSLTSGLTKRIKTEFSLFLPQSNNAGDTQPRTIHLLRIPEYFTVLKEKKYHLYSTWLGAEIVAKLVFIDAKNYITDFEIFDIVDALEKAEGKDANFYSWLGVKPSASQTEISKAYRKLSLKWHPDKNKGDPKAKERFARLGVIVSILRDPSKRERYNFFYKNGVPRWRGTGYLYSRFRPGLGSVVVVVMVIASGMQYIAGQVNYYQQRNRIVRFVEDARGHLAANAPKGRAPSLGKSFIEIGERAMRCEVKGDEYLIVYPDDREPVHWNTAWLKKPTIQDVFMIRVPKQWIDRLIGKKEPVQHVQQEAEQEEEVKEVKTKKKMVTRRRGAPRMNK